MLPHSEDPVILSSFIWIGYLRVTDGQTDGRTDGIAVGMTALCIASNAAALLKMDGETRDLPQQQQQI